jgi:acyl-CoA reductase-like NAD-dependent aldehyde dehydrogenase
VFDRPDLFVAGEWTKPATPASIDVVSPSSGVKIGSAALASRQDVDVAMAAARGVVDAGEWAGLEATDRIKVMRDMQAALEPAFDDLLRLVTHEMGVPIRVSRILHGAKALETINHACRAAEELLWTERREAVVPFALRQEPVGVVVAIAPWNGPFLQALYKLVYPLLAGCPVVFKPALETPLDAYFIAEAFEKAGLPTGLLSVLPGGSDIGQYLVEHAETDAVFFTGSTTAGRQIGATCGGQMKRAVLELGGKSAAIVCADADLDATVPLLSAGAFGNTGQNCAATTRILVPRPLHNAVTERLVESARALRVGDPFDEETDLGPLISPRQRQKVYDYVQLAAQDGAEVATGGRAPDRPGWFFEPTVLTGLDNASQVAQEEIFGPVVCVIPYDSEKEAVRMANDSPYGLHGAVFSQDLERAERIARQVRTGTMSINAFVLNGEAPFGGVKQSGIGRKHSVEGLREFLEPKTINYGAGASTFAMKA